MRKFAARHRALVLLAILAVVATGAGFALTGRPTGIVRLLSGAVAGSPEAGAHAAVPASAAAPTTGIGQGALTASSAGPAGIPAARPFGPVEGKLLKSPKSFDGDLRDLPYSPPERFEL